MSASPPDIELRLVSSGHVALPATPLPKLPRAHFRSWDERDDILRRIASQHLDVLLPSDMSPKFVGLFKDLTDGSTIAHYQVDAPQSLLSIHNDRRQWVNLSELPGDDLLDPSTEDRLCTDPSSIIN